MTPSIQTRVREVRAVQSGLGAGEPQRRWFRVSVSEESNVAVIAGGGFAHGVAFCILHKQRDCACARAVSDFGFLEKEPAESLPAFGEQTSGETT